MICFAGIYICCHCFQNQQFLTDDITEGFVSVTTTGNVWYEDGKSNSASPPLLHFFSEVSLPVLQSFTCAIPIEYQLYTRNLCSSPWFNSLTGPFFVCGGGGSGCKILRGNQWTSPVIQWLTFCLPMQGVQVWSLVGKLLMSESGSVLQGFTAPFNL